ncbi:tyrosine-type recombinase/integrase [Actinomadura macrotermitis]|uniref:Putative prophage phiRv2 integrase n=1 Tax=Actinomadura macrotermitis TaxID=2585200 RepID=A0A7K0C1M7_9ACTN|nr:site-specific integrase [Actinomadura macrotermitis]MQY07266.1 putative prophage phiRv2 integrase [Actinomadura macrotermitis]
MGYTKDLWTRPEETSDGKTKRVRNERWGKGKRWLACWTSPEGKEQSKAFQKKEDANRYWKSKETDKERGDYIDSKAGEKLFEDYGQRWLETRVVDPSSAIQYESKYRLHVAPTFGKRKINQIKPSEIQQWISGLRERYDTSTVRAAFLVLQGALELAVADGIIKTSPVQSKAVQVPSAPPREVEAWADERVFAVIGAHPERYRIVPVLGAACGLREGEVFGLAEEDIDFDEQVIKIRRQVKKVGRECIFALPKNDRSRIVPLPDWVADYLREYMEAFPPRPYTLPWEKVGGKPHTCRMLLRWHTDDLHVRARNFSESVWKPALVDAKVIPPAEPVKDEKPGKDGKRKTRMRYATTRKEGTHQMRHFYASVTLAEGVSIKELAEYLGHHDPGFTLRTYAHMLPCSHDRARKAIDNRMSRLPKPGSRSRDGADGP